MTHAPRQLSRSAAVLVVLALLPACLGAAEHAEVVVDGTDEVRRLTRSLELLVIAQPEGTLVLDDRLEVPRQGELPLTLVVAPEGGGDDRFHVIARAHSEPEGTGEIVARQLLLGSFAPGSAVHYRMLLEREVAP